ncbi:MAG: hypothetical protein IPK17_38490 [Chloroflexi bacterium]|uniref:hypothetical protein n=1 Tax=Candidatus Flexifilum breve TaxID=3140694 RepID=UPI00313758A1|nr:hypothetical protein [Chloroflexota bacterium]
MELLISEDDAPPPIPADFGFHHDEDYVFDRGNLFVHYRILPKAGGWDDQDSAWTDDLKLWLTLRARLLWERRRQSGDVPPTYTSIMDM